VLLISIFITPAPAAAFEQRQGIDAMLLIDLSGSMRTSDSARVAIEATKMFIDMLEPRNSRVGIIGFNDRLTGVVDITEINSHEDKERLKRTVENFNYAGWTDIGLSLNEAVGIMSRNMRATNSPMVLMLTDGKIELGTDNPYGRTAEDSYNDVVEAIAAAGRNLPVYTIGLNYDGSVDRQLLRTIAESTGARSFIITDAHELPQIFNEIFADHIRSTLIEVAVFTAGDDYTDVNIDIDSDFVAVANIVMLSDRGIRDARIFNPAGAEVIFDQETITFSNSRKYSIIKVMFPERGDWLLQVQGVHGDQIRVNLIYQYDISVDITVAQEEAIGRLFDPQSPVTITGRLLVNGEPVQGDELYRSTASNAIVTDIDDNMLFKIPMTVTRDGLVGSFTPVDDEPVVIIIETIADNFVKESREVVIQFEAMGAAPPIEPVAPLPDDAVDEAAQEQFGEIIWLFIAAAIVIATLILIAVLLMRKRKLKVFDGFLEVRAMNESGVYTSVEAPSLHTCVGATDLDRFLADNLPVRVRNEIAALPFSIRNLILSPATVGGSAAIQIDNRSGSATETEAGTAVGKKHIWKPDEKIIITSGDSDSIAKLEITYRTDEI